MDIESVSEDGVVTLSFSQKLVELAEFGKLNYTNLLVEIEAYDDDMAEYLEFTWQTISFGGSEAELLLTFKDPLYISYSDVADRVKITLIDNTLFQVDGKLARLPNQSVTEADIPLQTDQSSALQTLSDSVEPF